MNLRINDGEAINKFVQEAKLNDITVNPPSINNSYTKFSLLGVNGTKNITFGFNAVKNVGKNASENIIQTRKSIDKFKSIEDIFENIDTSIANTKTIESLVKVGAFDEFGDRSAILDKLEDLISVSATMMNAKKNNQTTMFEYLPEDQKITAEITLNQNINTNPIEKQNWEKELLGVKLSTNLENEKMIMQAGDSYITSYDQINNMTSNMNKGIKILGQPISIERLSYIDKRTNNEKFYFKSKVDLLDSELEAVCFNQNFNNTNLWDDHKLLVLDAYARNRNNQLSIYFNDAQMFQPELNNNKSDDHTSLVIEIFELINDDLNFQNLITYLKNSKGNIPVYIKMGNKVVEYNDIRVDMNVKEIIEINLKGFCSVKIENPSIFKITD